MGPRNKPNGLRRCNSEPPFNHAASTSGVMLRGRHREPPSAGAVRRDLVSSFNFGSVLLAVLPKNMMQTELHVWMSRVLYKQRGHNKSTQFLSGEPNFALQKHENLYLNDLHKKQHHLTLKHSRKNRNSKPSVDISSRDLQSRLQLIARAVKSFAEEETSKH